jgi:hypothetical protein
LPSRRPKRGDGGPLVEGDTGAYAGPQGGAMPGASESGDLHAREFGTPQADLPGGKPHLVNQQAKPAKTPDKGERPADYHKYHGVESDDGQYVTPPTEPVTGHPKAEPLPKISDAVPVYIVEHSDKETTYRDAEPVNINVNPNTKEPTRICNLNPKRTELLLLNEDSATDIRIGKLDELQVSSAQGTGPAGNGALIWHGTNSYTRLRTQGELWAITTSTASARLSVIEVTEVPR